MLVENLSVFLRDFGLDATVGSSTVRGIFDDAYGAGLDLIAGTKPVFLCASADVASVARGAAITIDGTGYTVQGIEPDGTGMTRLVLSQ